MKKQVVFLVGMLLNWIISISFAQENSIVGKWYAEDLEESFIEVQKNEKGYYEGIIKESSRDDYIGQKVIYDCLYDEENKRYKGKIYAISRNMNLDGVFELSKPDELKVTGKKLFISKTFYWKRE